MYTTLRSSDFDTWLSKLRDNIGKARIIARLNAAEHGNFGECESVGSGIHEMRVHAGPGYRVYFTQRGHQVIFLLLGGNKSTQKRDIKRAQLIAKLIED